MEKKRIIIVSIFIVLFIIAIILSMVNYSGKYSVIFETGTNDTFLTRYVNKNDKIDIPQNPIKEGYVFKEWQLDGEKFDFDSPITSNIILTADWIKEEYIEILFDTTLNEKIDSIKILKGEIIDNLPVLSLEQYEFAGWFINDKKYNNEELYDDTVLVAKFLPIDNTLKVGDAVIIIGSYSNAAYFIDYVSTKAIGWERTILEIFEDGIYPYEVGDETGVTGFFKEDSLKKK